MPDTPLNQRKQFDGFGRIQLDDDALDTEIADIKNPAALSGSVGQSGQNNRRDVAKVETMLGEAGALDLKQTDGPTGYWGTRTAEATKKVQADNGLKVDAEINPNGPTVRKLGEIANPRNATKRRKERRDRRREEAAAAGQKNAVDQAVENLTRWHFEDREAKNKPLPSSMRRADRAGFEMYPQWQNEYHQNNIGEPEVKYVHPDGREVIYDGDTRKVVIDPELKGTFNYANAPARKEKPENTEEWMRYLFQNGPLEHILYDIAPYEIEKSIRRMKSDKK